MIEYNFVIDWILISDLFCLFISLVFIIFDESKIHRFLWGLILIFWVFMISYHIYP